MGPLSPSSLFHLITRPGQRPNKLFPEQSARGPQLRQTTAVLLFCCPTKGRRWTDGRTRGRKWKDGSSPASRVLPTVKHSLCKYCRDKASMTRKYRPHTHSATRKPASHNYVSAPPLQRLRLGADLAVICVPWLVKVDMERNTTCKLLTREKVSGRHMGREKHNRKPGKNCFFLSACEALCFPHPFGEATIYTTLPPQPFLPVVSWSLD